MRAIESLYVRRNRQLYSSAPKEWLLRVERWEIFRPSILPILVFLVDAEDELLY